MAVASTWPQQAYACESLSDKRPGECAHAAGRIVGGILILHEVLAQKSTPARVSLVTGALKSHHAFGEEADSRDSTDMPIAQRESGSTRQSGGGTLLELRHENPPPVAPETNGNKDSGPPEGPMQDRSSDQGP